MPDDLGPAMFRKRATQHLAFEVDSAIQIARPGGVAKAMVNGGMMFGAVGGLLTHGAKKALDKRQPEQEDSYPLPLHALLAVDSENLYLFPCSDAGKVKKGTPHETIPLADVGGMTLTERKVSILFELDLMSGQVLRAETKRIGMNRHNLGVLQAIEARTS